jgi:hypothetical protein
MTKAEVIVSEVSASGPFVIDSGELPELVDARKANKIKTMVDKTGQVWVAPIDRAQCSRCGEPVDDRGKCC